MPDSVPPGLTRQQQREILQRWLVVALRRPGRVVPLLAMLLVAVAVLHTSAEVTDGGAGDAAMLVAGAYIPDQLLRGQWWRLLTWPWLHADWSHLIVNLLMLLVIGRPLEAAYGGVRLWLIWTGSVMAASTLMLLHPPVSWTVGASGAVFGLLGALFALGLKLLPRLDLRMRWSMVGVPGLSLLILLLLGQDDRTDNLAHVGGAMGGLLLGAALRPQFLPVAPMSRARHAAVWLRVLAWGTAAMTATAAVLAAWQYGKPLELPPVQLETFAYDQLRVQVPAGLPHGTVTMADFACKGELTDPPWALRTGRMPCWRLPLSGTLILGERKRLFTLDDDDRAAFVQAKQTGRWAYRQPGVAVAPVGDRWVWLLTAQGPLLPTYRKMLAQIAEQARDADLSMPQAQLPDVTTPVALPVVASPVGTQTATSQ